MSDRAPKVKVEQNTNGQWIAFCREPYCDWIHTPDAKTYVQQQASWHRRQHREAAARG